MVAENETTSPQEVPPKALVMTVQIIDNVVGRGSGLLFAGLVLPMVGGLSYEVFARYLFNAPTIWAYDVTYMLYGSHFMLGAAYTLYKGSHIRTDLLYEKFPLKWKGIVDATMYLVFFFPGMLFFMFAGWDEAMHAWGIGERSDASPWRPIIYPFKTVVPVAAALLMTQGFSEFLKSAYAALRGERLIEVEPPALRGDII